jgi:hypothetical protein
MVVFSGVASDAAGVLIKVTRKVAPTCCARFGKKQLMGIQELLFCW